MYLHDKNTQWRIFNHFLGRQVFKIILDAIYLNTLVFNNI